MLTPKEEPNSNSGLWAALGLAVGLLLARPPRPRRRVKSRKAQKAQKSESEAADADA